MNRNDRVVVTGAGVVTSLGSGMEAFSNGLFEGRSCVAPSARLQGSAACEVPDFTPVPWLGPKGIRVLDRAARLLAVASHMALDHAGLLREPSEEGDAGLGLVCGTMFGGVHSIATFDYAGIMDGPNGVNPADFPNTVINSPTGHAGIRFKMRGVNTTISAGLASGLQAIGYAADILRFGRSKAVLAGGLEELCEESMSGFHSTGLLAADRTVRPFGIERSGTVPGEGAALWVLELEESARARHAVPLLEVLGFGAAHDGAAAAAIHSKGRGAADAMREAITSAGISPAEVSCIFASANGARLGDEIEARALDEVFSGNPPPVCAPKAFWGEAMGASGALAALAAGVALERGLLPPTPSHRATDYALQLSASAQPLASGPALINALGCDGINVSLVIGLCRN